MDEQVALMASFEMEHREESTRQFMATEREALAAMLVVRANVAREAARVAAEEEAARVVARAAEAALELAAREEAARAEEVAREAAGAVALAEELAEEAAAEATVQEEMTRDRRRWDDDMAAARRAREVHELATQRRHRRNLARRQAHRASQPAARAPTPSIWAGAITCCRRQQDEDGGAKAASRGRVV
jgi:hypothetical protein